MATKVKSQSELHELKDKFCIASRCRNCNEVTIWGDVNSECPYDRFLLVTDRGPRVNVNAVFDLVALSDSSHANS